MTHQPRLNFGPPVGAGLLKYLVIVAFLVLAGCAAFLWSQQNSLRSELEQLRTQAAQLQQEKTDLEQRQTQAKPADDSTAQELAKLRGEVARLRNVEKQFLQLQTDAQQLRANVQQLQQANAETAALRTQNAQMQNTLQAQANTALCINNLRQIFGAKQQWALENKKNAYDVPLDQEIFGKYIPQKPACPAGGIYTLGPVQAKPTCTIAGHTF